MTCDLDIYRATKLLVEPHGVRGTETGGASRLDLWLDSESNAARSLSAKVRQGSKEVFLHVRPELLLSGS